MVGAAMLAALGALLVGGSAARAESLDLAAWAAGLPPRFSASGVKNEPTYQAAIDIARDGDRFTIAGGAPAWMGRATEAVRVDEAGRIAHTVCPPGMDCRAAAHPAGFLSSASLLAALRRGALHGRRATERFGTFEVVCVPGEMLAIPDPILDPCFERRSGVAIAGRHRESRRFDGPMLDPVSARIRIPSVPPTKDPAS